MPLPRFDPTRRWFLKSAAWGAAGAVVAPTILPASALGRGGRSSPNERINVAVIGYGGRGQRVTGTFLNSEDVRVVAVCDVKGDRREAARQRVNRHYGNEDCEAYIDFQQILARPDVDAVLIATGDNWHSLLSILAAEAGKDIYCEKPLSVTIGESRAVAETMRRYGTVFQCGTQRRSLGHFLFALNLAWSGKLGELKELHAETAGAWTDPYLTRLPGKPEPARKQFDWDRWLGPANWRPYNPRYPKRGFWGGHLDFAGGSITEWGAHTADLCQWANRADDTTPVHYWREGERIVGQYANGVRLLLYRPVGQQCTVRFVGDESWVQNDDTGQSKVEQRSLLGSLSFSGGWAPDSHVRAFLNAVKTREQTVAHADAAHHSVTACHLANLCKRLDRELRWDPEAEAFTNDDEANRMRLRAYRSPWML
jgi:predicted dehydrogenase